MKDMNETVGDVSLNWNVFS